ncbi:hypothetical protein A2U01_0023355, partial [Trifolium medium]|nr:hypothetical protein [Trifolium medium]
MPEASSLQLETFGKLSRLARWARDCSLGERGLVGSSPEASR